MVFRVASLKAPVGNGGLVCAFDGLLIPLLVVGILKKNRRSKDCRNKKRQEIVAEQSRLWKISYDIVCIEDLNIRNAVNIAKTLGNSVSMP